MNLIHDDAWWRLNRKYYSSLFYCPRRILNIPGSSIPSESSESSESLFPEADDQVTKKRNRLDPERVDKMVGTEEFHT